jgi:hypothetical protein
MNPIPRERRRHVERLTKAQGVATDPRITYEARLLYVAAALRCSDAGHISKDAATAAFRDPLTRSTAMNILTKLGCPPAGGLLS